jgi:heme exporter protein D
MYFDSLQSLIHMDGHGVFVWSAYAVAVVVIAWLLVAPLRRRRRLLSEIAAARRRDSARVDAAPAQNREESLNAPGA